MEKNVKFLKGPYPTAKLSSQLDGNYCRKPGRRTFFIVKKEFQVGITEKKNNWF